MRFWTPAPRQIRLRESAQADFVLLWGELLAPEAAGMARTRAPRYAFP